jgi:hypothetical protein
MPIMTGFCARPAKAYPPPPITQAKEEKIIRFLTAEINNIFGLNLDPEPDQCRQLTASFILEPAKRVLLTIGASHMNCIADDLQKMGFNVINIAKPG